MFSDGCDLVEVAVWKLVCWFLSVLAPEAHCADGFWSCLPVVVGFLFRSLCAFGAQEQLAVGLFVPSACLSVTWLILPVVICLSQRLSHACASINA